jgi:SAM-dependent methyltransferase
MKAEELKLIVQEKYGEIAGKSVYKQQISCCGNTGCCGDMDYTVFSEDYNNLKGYNPDADLGLGCGIPTQFADIRTGDSVLDLGSGAGNDCFVARAQVGESGKVTGIDFTDAMLEKARENAGKLGYANVEFVKGDIENMPLPDSAYDIVISNCVINLVPDKLKAFQQIYRVLKPGGHFCISDVVLSGKLPENLQRAAEMYAGCVSGALVRDEYLNLIAEAGFSEIQVKKEKIITVPDIVLEQYLSGEELDKFHESGTGIFSVTVTASKI